MLDRKYFQRNADGTLKTKQPCETPGCMFPNWHLCSGPAIPNYDELPIRKPSSRQYRAIDVGREIGIAKMRQIQIEKIERENEINRERDEMVIRDHDRGYSKADLMRKYGFKSYDKLNAVLERRDEFVYA